MILLILVLFSIIKRKIFINEIFESFRLKDRDDAVFIYSLLILLAILNIIVC